MFYLYTIIIPLVIVGVLYFFNTSKLRGFEDYINLLFTALKYYFTYALLLEHFFIHKHVKEVGWVLYTLAYFLYNIGIPIIILKLYFWIKGLLKKNSNKTNTDFKN